MKDITAIFENYNGLIISSAKYPDIVGHEVLIEKIAAKYCAKTTDPEQIAEADRG